MLGIITVAAHEDERLGRTLTSVANLSDEVEHLVVVPHDDLATIAYVENFLITKPRNTRLINDKSHGIYQAMNEGIRASKSTHLIFLNAGDEIKDSEAFSEFSFELTISDALWGICAAEIEWGTRNIRTPDELNRFLRQENRFFLSHQSIAFQNQQLFQFGGYDTKFQVAGDTDLIYKFAKIDTPIFVDKTVVRVEQPNFASRNNRRGRFETLRILFAQSFTKSKYVAITKFTMRELFALMGG
jgi:glycosyltransferase involved in cell wall biosynthesis